MTRDQIIVQTRTGQLHVATGPPRCGPVRVSCCGRMLDVVHAERHTKHHAERGYPRDLYCDRAARRLSRGESK